jgi:hypothetical protein
MKGVLIMEERAKVYVCGAVKCRFNDKYGGCNRNSDELLINDNGVCGHFGRTGELLANALLDEIKQWLLNEHGDEMQENLAEYELCTDTEFNCYMCRENDECMQDFACNEAIAVLVDAYNVVKFGKPIHCTVGK